GIYNASNRAVGVLNPTGSTFFPGGAPQGNNVALTWLDDGDLNNQHMGLAQVLTTDLAPSTHYRLSVEVGNIDSGTGSPPYDVFGFFNIEGFPGYRVQLLAGGVVLAEDDNSLGASLAEGTFGTSIIDFVSPANVLAGQALEIRLINLNLPGTPGAPGIEVDFDDVRLDAAPLGVPAPAVAPLLGAAALGWWAARRRRAFRPAHPA
ncbi:MAG: PEP-CTERM sorting domain-containing protein, partial [Rhodocyclaceae bacterium]|nr:PEP-CTERM sorting domain-containing protein [Rhodocyclaceae bacterium]